MSLNIQDTLFKLEYKEHAIEQLALLHNFTSESVKMIKIFWEPVCNKGFIYLNDEYTFVIIFYFILIILSLDETIILVILFDLVILTLYYLKNIIILFYLITYNENNNYFM